LIQRQFEDPDDDRCYIETHDVKYCGHFLLRRVDFTPQKLSIELDRPRDNFVSVTFAMVATEFAEACCPPGSPYVKRSRSRRRRRSYN
jgi:hypothetical protein